MTRRSVWLALSLLTFLASPAAAGEDKGGSVRVEGFGSISEEPAYFAQRHDTPVNPRSRLLTFPEWENRIVGNLNATIAYRDLKMVAKFRPTVEIRSTETDHAFPVDDLYLDVNLFKRAFLTVGVKNYRDGVGLSLNPTDFLAENKKQDFTKREEERRADREGNVVAGIDLFLKNVTLSAVVTPRMDVVQDENTRAVLKVTTLVEAAKLDAAISYFLADRPGVGLNLSQTAGDRIELHAEVAGRWGSPRKHVRKLQEAIDNARPALFEIRAPADRDKVFAELVAGGSYTFGEGTNVIGEYYFIQDGYSDRQWDRVREFIKFSRSRFLAGAFGGLPEGNLLLANQLLTFRRLRQHYLFFRLHNARLLESFDASVSLLLNAEDQSVAIAPIIDFIGIKNLRLGINATILEGERHAEFGLSPFRARVSLLLRYFF